MSGYLIYDYEKHWIGQIICVVKIYEQPPG